MFHLKPMKSVWASVELKKAIEKGYKITILAGYDYKRYNGLKKGYVEKFLKMKNVQRRRIVRRRMQQIERRT
jgi:hypothetical protein